MDKTTERIVDYSRSFSASELTAPVREAAINHLVDTVAVAIAGIDSEPGRIAARLARATTGDPGATVFGYELRTSPDLAAFANSVMVRTYDWNDGMQARSGGHPSDMIPGILAVGETVHASGLDVLVAMTLAYELLGGICPDITIMEKGLDQGTFMSVATAMGAGKLLHLDRAQLANAVALALVPNVPLGVSRWGALSMMKGSATAFAVRAGVFAVLLAREGFTGAPEPFEGILGLQHVVGAFTPP